MVKSSMAVAVALACLLFTAVISGQEARKGRPPFSMVMVRSPEVTHEGRVTFRVRAPNAKEVFVARDGTQRLAMQKDEQGVWSATTEPLEPDIYPYTFAIDGVSIADPSNPLVKPIVMGGNQSLVHVPGPRSLSWEVNDVPRGTIHEHLYTSRVIGEPRAFYVYTPPGYDPAGTEEYPVLYLLHGMTDDARAWTTAGRAHVILDNLIAQGKARPMIMVNPLGYGFADPGQNLFSSMRDADAQRKGMEDFAATILEEIVPQVEKAYRVKANRDNRAIAGLSMGGAQAMYLGLNHPDRFGWVASFSGAFVMYGEDPAGSFPTLSADSLKDIRLIWTACGADDFLIKSNRDFDAWLKSKSVQFTSAETPGAHTWMVWRRYLTELAPLLFRDQDK
jgi:enterochelin esterase family protein